MSGTTISSAVNFGIVLAGVYQSPLTITDTGSIFASGAYASAIYSDWSAPAIIANAGVVYAGGYGINLHDGGTITNGSALYTGASIKGGYEGILAGARAPVSVTNFGTIASTNFASGVGVNIGGDGSITNGTNADAAAAMSGYFEGVFIGGNGTVSNYGTIQASATSPQLGSSSVGLYIRLGGSIVNGSPSDFRATITGVDFAVQIGHAPGTVANFGTISGTGPLARGLMLLAGGTVVNGTSADAFAYIGALAKNGIYAGGTISSSITNFGTVTGGKNGVALQNGGTVVNGSAGSRQATISGARQGVYVEGNVPSLVTNDGTIRSIGGFWGVSMYLRGTVINGGPTNPTALIAGGGGVYEGSAATVVNYGQIQGSSRPGVELRTGGTLTNFGTIGGYANTAVYFGNGPSRLLVAPGAVFDGGVQGGAGPNVLELMAGPNTGTIAGIGSAIANFNTVVSDPNAVWMLTGSNAASDLSVKGTIIVADTLVVAGSLDASAAGLLTFAPSATLEIAAVLGAGPTIQFLQKDTLIVDQGAQFGTHIGASNFASPLLESFAAGDHIDMKDLAYTGIILLDYDSDSGVLEIGRGSGPPVEALQFDPATLGAGNFHIASDGGTGTLLTHS